MPNIRKRKKISRRKMARDLNFPESFIKQIETEDCQISNNILEKIAMYLKVEVADLIIDTDEIMEKMFKHIPDNVQKVNVELPEGVDEKQAISLFEDLLMKYKPQSDEEVQKMLAEYHYRLGDLEEETPSNIKELLNSLNEEHKHDYEDDVINEEDITEIIKHIRLDARLASEAYKELKNQNLSMFECLEILKIIMND